jgi:hypothetical protein
VGGPLRFKDAFGKVVKNVTESFTVFQQRRRLNRPEERRSSTIDKNPSFAFDRVDHRQKF